MAVYAGSIVHMPGLNFGLQRLQGTEGWLVSKPARQLHTMDGTGGWGWKALHPFSG